MAFNCGNKYRLLNNDEFLGIVKIYSGITYYKLRRINRYESKKNKSNIIIKNGKDSLFTFKN